MPQVESVTPLLFVRTIEPSLPFWTEGLGFEKTAEVPEGDALAFVMLQRGEVTVMLQTGASIQADIPSIAAEALRGPATLFVKVDTLDRWVDTPPPGATVVMERRTTFYGMDEIGYRAPDGTLVILAAPLEEAGE